MKTEQIRFENNKLELMVKRPSHFITLLLLSAASLCIIVPILYMLNLFTQRLEGIEIHSLTILITMIPIIFGIYLSRIFIWNFYGTEVYAFENDRIIRYFNYKYFKSEKREISTKQLEFKAEHSGFENERKSILIIQSGNNNFKSKIELKETELKQLIEELNQKYI